MILLDICELIVDCPHSTAKDEGHGFPLIRTPNIGKGRLILDNVHRVCKEVYDKRNIRAIPQVNDIILAREAPAGNVALITKGQKVCLGQRTVLIRPNINKVNPEYLVYYMLSPKVQHDLQSSANGATVAHINMPKIRNLKIQIPNRVIQDKIATILSRYDALIENYQKQIKLLEESAQRLYKEWFVDLRFPGHENTKVVDGVPEGWEKKCLGDFCLIFTGKKNANSNIKNGKYKFFTCGDKPLSINSYIYDGAAIIISGNGSYTGRTTFFKGKFDLYQRTYACTIKSGFNNNFIYGLYEFVNSELTSQISGGTHGAAIPYIVMSDLTGFTFLYNEYVLLKFSSIIKKNLLETIKIIDRIQLLTEARDRLLPKLMSGEIEV